VAGSGYRGEARSTVLGRAGLAGHVRGKGSWARASHAGEGGEGRPAGPPAGFGPLG
jgi:hypothetical protein